MFVSFQVTNAVGESAIESVDFVLRPRVKWYHLILTHSVGTTFGAESQLKMYIDSKLRFHQVFIYQIYIDLCTAEARQMKKSTAFD